MADVTTNALRGIVKTLSDVVVPAIPADDPLALQELKMVIRYLAFARERVDHLYARARWELAFNAGLIGSFAAPLERGPPEQARLLAALRDRANALLAEPGAAIGDLRNLHAEINTAITTLLGVVRDAALLREIERGVVRAAAEQTAFDRSWYAPLKLERFPSQLRALDTFIPMRKQSF